MGTYRIWLFRLLLVGGSLVLVLMASEIALRVLDPGGASLTVKDPVLGHRYRAGASKRVYDDEAERAISIDINALGFRDREHDAGPSDHPRVVVLGDSFVAGFAVDVDFTVSRVLETTLRERSGEPWEVISLGVAAYSTAQELVAYDTIGSSFHPDHVVLLFFAGNDVSDNSSELSNFPRKYYRLDDDGALMEEPSSELRGLASRLLNEHSRFYVWQKSRMREVEHLFKRTVEVDPVHRVFEATYEARVERAWAITEALLETLRDRVERDGASFLTVYVPYADEVNPGWWDETLENAPVMQEREWDLEKPSRLLEEIADRSELSLLMPRQAMLEALAVSGEPLYFHHGHFNENGHRFVAELIAESVLDSAQ